MKDKLLQRNKTINKKLANKLDLHDCVQFQHRPASYFQRIRLLMRNETIAEK